LALVINSEGDSIGQSYIGNSYEGVYWNASGASTVLGVGDSDYPRALNDIGEIGGFSSSGVDGSGFYATEWTTNGSILWESLDPDSEIAAMNSTGAAVGYDGNNAVYWSPTGVETVLAVGTHRNPDRAIAINDSGNSIGSNSTDTRAYEWSNTGETVDLKKLPGTAPAELRLNAINDRDNVVGAEYSNGQWIAVGWRKTGKPVNLQTILGSSWTDTIATGINDANDICGYGDNNGIYSAFELLWVPKAGSPDGGTYVNADHSNALAASALHTQNDQESSGGGNVVMAT